MEAPIVAAFGHPCEGVKVAACSCVKSLSRSVKVSLSPWPIHMKTYVSQGSCWVHFSLNFRVPSLMIVLIWAEPSDGLNRWTLGDSSAATIEWSLFSGAGVTVFQHYVIGGFCLSGVHWGSQKEVTRSFFWPYIPDAHQGLELFHALSFFAPSICFHKGCILYVIFPWQFLMGLTNSFFLFENFLVSSEIDITLCWSVVFFWLCQLPIAL